MIFEPVHLGFHSLLYACVCVHSYMRECVLAQLMNDRFTFSEALLDNSVNQTVSYAGRFNLAKL